MFLAVASSGSVTRAARVSGCSQPSVTRAIQALEAELGFPLLQRVGRGVVLSEAGLEFEGEAKRMLASFSELAERARQIGAGRGRPLQIATTAAIGAALIPAALADMGGAALPEVHLAQFAPTTVSQQVRIGQSEIGFSSLPLDAPGLDVLRLYSAPNVAVLRADDPLAAHDVVPLEAFSGRPLTTMLDPARFTARVSRAMEDRGICAGSFLRTNVAYAALHLVRETGTAGILDPITAFTVGLDGVVVRPIDVEVPFFWGAIAVKGAVLRPLATNLVAAVERVALRRIPGLDCLDPARAGEIARGTADWIGAGR